jgi:hypothetical protein
MASDYHLTPEQLIELQFLIDAQSGKPAAQQDWTAAYAFIASIIQGSGVSEGVQFFFQNAIDSNADSPNAASNFFIRDYYTYAASLEGVTLTNEQVQAVSGKIGFNVLTDILNNGGVVHGEIRPIIDNDIRTAVTEIPGVSEPLSFATWGASLFAEDKLGYTGFFDKYFTTSQDWQIFYAAASKACVDTGANLLLGNLQGPLAGQDALSCVNVFNMAGLYAQQQVLAAEAEGTQLILNAIKAGLDALWNLFVPSAGGAELQNDLNTLDVFGSSSLVNGDVVVNLYAGDGSTGLLTFATDGMTSVAFGPAVIQFGASEAVNLSSTSGQGLTIGIAPEPNGVSRDILLDQPSNSGELQQGGTNFIEIPAGSSVVLANGDVAITTVLGNGVTVTTTWSQDGTLSQTFQSPDSSDPIRIMTQPDPATGTVEFKSVASDSQTTQLGGGDTAATDGGLSTGLAVLTGTDPEGNHGGSDLTDPGDHPADDPRAPFAAKHPSPPDPRDPLVLDLAGLGIKLSSVTQSAAHFDFTGSGFATKTGWITQGEGLLVLDGNPNAPISVDELVGAASGDGFADLAALDANSDGAITTSDAAVAQLSVWIDGNGNGREIQHHLEVPGIITALVSGSMINADGEIRNAIAMKL